MKLLDIEVTNARSVHHPTVHPHPIPVLLGENSADSAFLVLPHGMPVCWLRGNPTA